MSHISRQAASACLGSLMIFGCAASREPPLVPPPVMLGSEVDQLMTQQERNAESSKFVIPMHEFELNQKLPDGRERGWRLNEFGEDHVKQIAARLRQGHDFPVVIERSQTTALDNTEFEYPVHFNEDLDWKRRAVVVAALVRLGISDADQRVVAAPSLAEGITANEAVRAYSRVVGTNNQSGSASGRGSGGGTGSGASGAGGGTSGAGGGAATGPAMGNF